jgi:hypothetical protein
MPTAETLERFIARVESNAHVEAIEDFYTDDATMRENMNAPRVGRATLMAAGARHAVARALGAIALRAAGAGPRRHRGRALDLPL